MIDVLAVGPHPDDVELAAGGTIALLAAAGARVLLLDLTAGERATRGDPHTRAQEAAEAARVLGVEGRECLGLPDGGLSAESVEQRAALIGALRRHRPRLVLALHENDDHPDHVAAAHIVRRAAYTAGLRSAAPGHAAPFRPERVIFAMGRRPFVPSFVVDISANRAVKARALAAYASQFTRAEDDPLVTPISDPLFLPRLEARDRHFGGMIGVEFGEPFFEDGPVPVRTVLALWGGGDR